MQYNGVCESCPLSASFSGIGQKNVAVSGEKTVEQHSKGRLNAYFGC